MATLDYRARPAKTIVRRMIVETCRKLSIIAALDEYEYIGFGGLEFIDFDLVHRVLGVKRMISIEDDSESLTRYEFNRPFAGIRIVSGRATEELPNLDWRGLKIVWLDYEARLTPEVLRDCEVVARSLEQGSMFLVTLNAGGGGGRRVELLRRDHGDRVPTDLKEQDLERWGFARTQWQILSDAVMSIADRRAGGFRFRQVLNVVYRDGQRMQTIGWIVESQGLAATVDRCGFDDLSFVSRDETPFVVEVPILTAREIDHLNRQLPLSGRKKVQAPWLRPEEAQRFVELYRWYSA